jgi:hypothetical protein
MRLLIAIGLFMLSLVLMLLGVAQRTVWAPPANYSLSVNYEAGNPYVVIPNSTLAIHTGTPKITAAGPRNVFIATGRESDITAWVGQSPRTLIEANQKKTKLLATAETGADATISPIGADLWRTSVVAEKTATSDAPVDIGGAVLLASDGVSPAPDSVTLTWPIKFDLLPSNLLLGFGFGILVLALIMNFLSYRSMRRRRGPRRKVPKAPQGPRIRLGKQPSMAPPRGSQDCLCDSGRCADCVAA